MSTAHALAAPPRTRRALESACEVALARQWEDAASAYAILLSAVQEYTTTSQDSLQAASNVINILRSHDDARGSPWTHADNQLGVSHTFEDLTPGVSVPNFAIAAPDASALNWCRDCGPDCSGISAGACVSAWQQEYDSTQAAYARLHTSAADYSSQVVNALHGASRMFSVFVEQIDVTFYDWGGFRAIYAGSGVVPPTPMDQWVGQTFRDNPVTHQAQPCPVSSCEHALISPSLGPPTLSDLVIDRSCPTPLPFVRPPSAPASWPAPPSQSSPPSPPPSPHGAPTVGVIAGPPPPELLSRGDHDASMPRPPPPAPPPTLDARTIAIALSEVQSVTISTVEMLVALALVVGFALGYCCRARRRATVPPRCGTVGVAPHLSLTLGASNRRLAAKAGRAKGDKKVQHSALMKDDEDDEL